MYGVFLAGVTKGVGGPRELLDQTYRGWQRNNMAEPLRKVIDWVRERPITVVYRRYVSKALGHEVFVVAQMSLAQITEMKLALSSDNYDDLLAFPWEDLTEWSMGD